MMKKIIQVFLLAMAASPAQANNAVSTGESLACDLGCKNGGYCTLVDGTVEELAHLAQSGRLIEKCVCRPGFAGTTCETVVEECQFPERKCHNGASCVQHADGEWGCDCSLADALSDFAGHQCRKSVTEYCTGKYDPHAALSFCTNGGRCEGDFLAAKVAPGDTSFNKAYQHRGCRCPSEFHGPHCEFLKLTDEDLQTSKEGTKGHTTTIIVSFMSLCALFLFCALVYKKMKSKRLSQEISVEHDITTSWGNGYSDARFNGRHKRPQSSSVYNSRNLHVQSVFTDAIIA